MLGSLFLLTAVSATSAAGSSVQPVVDVLARTLGEHAAAQFELILAGPSLCADGAPDCFALSDAAPSVDGGGGGGSSSSSSSNKTVRIVGSTLSALSAGAGVYLKRHCNASLTWAKTGGLLGGMATAAAAASAPLPSVGRPASAPPLLVSKASRWTYYMNVVDFSYR